ncbi:MAG: DUF721 domain-containing protein [Bacillota bacterium]
MKEVGPIIEKILKRYNLWQGYKQHLLMEHWDNIVGPELAEVTRVEDISNGILRVTVKDSVWAYHLSLLKPQLKKKLNDYAESKMVNDIYFTID